MQRAWNAISFSASRAGAHVGRQSHHLNSGKIPDCWRVGKTKIITVKDHRTSRLFARHVCHLPGKQSCARATSLSKLEKQTELWQRPSYFLVLSYLLHDTKICLLLMYLWNWYSAEFLHVKDFLCVFNVKYLFSVLNWKPAEALKFKQKCFTWNPFFNYKIDF
jgi:hypothetical protein